MHGRLVENELRRVEDALAVAGRGPTRREAHGPGQVAIVERDVVVAVVAAWRTPAGVVRVQALTLDGGPFSMAHHLGLYRGPAAADLGAFRTGATPTGLPPVATADELARIAGVRRRV